MRLGIFAKTFRGPSLDVVLQKIAAQGIHEVHFNLSCAGLETLPANLTESQCQSIRDSFCQHNLNMCSISGTYNIIHPDLVRRAEWTRRASNLIKCCSALGTRLVTLCTGTRDPNDMWTNHAANRDPSSWNDLVRTILPLIEEAERYQVFLGIEPEQSNVIHSASKARALLDHFQSPQLKIVLDAANLLHSGNTAQMESIFDEAVELLGNDISVAHAKDFQQVPERPCAPGRGALHWRSYLQALAKVQFEGPLVLQNLSEVEVTDSLSFLKEQLKQLGHIYHANV